MADTCPKCGAEVLRTKSGFVPAVQYTCGALSAVDGSGVRFEHSVRCLLRQLAQRDERIKELEAERAAWLPIVRAAVTYMDVGNEGRDTEITFGALDRAVRALTPEQRARLEVRT